MMREMKKYKKISQLQLANNYDGELGELVDEVKRRDEALVKTNTLNKTRKSNYKGAQYHKERLKKEEKMLEQKRKKKMDQTIKKMAEQKKKKPTSTIKKNQTPNRRKTFKNRKPNLKIKIDSPTDRLPSLSGPTPTERRKKQITRKTPTPKKIASQKKKTRKKQRSRTPKRKGQKAKVATPTNDDTSDGSWLSWLMKGKKKEEKEAQQEEREEKEAQQEEREEKAERAAREMTRIKGREKRATPKKYSGQRYEARNYGEAAESWRDWIKRVAWIETPGYTGKKPKNRTTPKRYTGLRAEARERGFRAPPVVDEDEESWIQWFAQWMQQEKKSKGKRKKRQTTPKRQRQNNNTYDDENNNVYDKNNDEYTDIPPRNVVNSFINSQPATINRARELFGWSLERINSLGVVMQNIANNIYNIIPRPPPGGDESYDDEPKYRCPSQNEVFCGEGSHPSIKGWCVSDLAECDMSRNESLHLNSNRRTWSSKCVKSSRKNATGDYCDK